MTVDLPPEYESFCSFVATHYKNGKCPSLEEAVEAYRTDQEQADGIGTSGKSPMARLRQIRDRYVAGGGKLFTVDEINSEVAEGRCFA